MNGAVACAKAMVGGGGAWFGKVACMPQPAEPQDAEAFVGRSHELAVLSAALRQAATGDARLALVSGEPGIGKTALARSFARRAIDVITALESVSPPLVLAGLSAGDVRLM